MARIRTIKPDFWTDDAIIECSPMARMLFVGTWNFADDEGNLDRSSKQLKCKIFPADSVEVEPLIQELLAQNLLIEYECDGKKYLNIRSFKKHQVVNRPSKSRIPPYQESSPNHDYSSPIHGGFIEGSVTEGKGREGKGKEYKSSSSSTEVEIETASPPDTTPVMTMTMTMKDFNLKYHQTFQTLMPPLLNEECRRIINHFPRERIENAFMVTASNRGETFEYFRKVLENGGKKRKPTREESAEEFLRMVAEEGS